MANLDLSTIRVKKIAILCRQQLGDFILTITLLNFCRELFPDARIWLFGWDLQQPLLKYFSVYDHFVILSDKHSRTLNIWKNAVIHRKHNFDLAIDTKDNPSVTGSLFSFLLGAKYRTGFVKNALWSKLVNYGVEFRPEQKGVTHTAVKYLRFLDPDFETVPTKFYPQFRIPLVVREQYELGLNQALSSLADCSGPLLLVSVSNKRFDCFLGVERYAIVLNKVFQQMPFRMVIAGIPKDLALAQALAKALSMPNATVLTGELDRFLILLEMVDACFIGEGGVGHMAAALNKPQLILYGRVSVEAWKPLAQHITCLFHPMTVKDLATDLLASELRQLLSRCYPRAGLL